MSILHGLLQDALRRAVAEDPGLAQQYPELAAHVAKNEAEAEKDRGNSAFAAKRCGFPARLLISKALAPEQGQPLQGVKRACIKACRYEDAVGHFSRCIALDKSSEVYHSNRAAALTALKRYGEALEDGRAVVRLRPKWAKGWARCGAAHVGLEEYGEVRNGGMLHLSGKMALVPLMLAQQRVLLIQLGCAGGGHIQGLGPAMQSILAHAAGSGGIREGAGAGAGRPGAAGGAPRGAHRGAQGAGGPRAQVQAAGRAVKGRGPEAARRR